ncbi:MAG TPA: helix-turn-helix transcriptional regulator [Pyrinomonadaceae bacterium]|nr:helix-turn-helix transcriptional regulator [Pyrinomonadaceae bacterium]
MIKIKIQEYLKSQAVENAYQLQQILGISPTVAARLWKGDFDKIGINTIDKICWEFDCQPNDLFEFVRQKEGNQAFKSSGIADVRSKWLSR